MAEFDKVVREKKLPRVGQTVRSKKFGTLWRVMEKKEVWRNIDPDPKTGDPRMVPAIYLMFWKVQEGDRPGVGKLMGFEYTLYDNTFELNWDTVS
jgi:hypothetical protein